MSKQPTPKADALRAMREAQFEARDKPSKPSVAALRSGVAGIAPKRKDKKKRKIRS